MSFHVVGPVVLAGACIEVETSPLRFGGQIERNSPLRITSEQKFWQANDSPDQNNFLLKQFNASFSGY